MKVLLVGVGTVGEAIARLSAGRPWLEQMVLAGHDLDRVRQVANSIGDAASHPVAQLDAPDGGAVEALAREYGIDLVMNAVDPRFLMPVFRGALAADVNYVDMAVSMSTPHLLTRAAGIAATTTRIQGATHPVLAELAPGARVLSGPIVVAAPAASVAQPGNAAKPRRRNRGRSQARSGGPASGTPKSTGAGSSSTQSSRQKSPTRPTRRGTPGRPSSQGSHSAAAFSAGRR